MVFRLYFQMMLDMHTLVLSWLLEYFLNLKFGRLS